MDKKQTGAELSTCTHDWGDLRMFAFGSSHWRFLTHAVVEYRVARQQLQTSERSILVGDGATTMCCAGSLCIKGGVVRDIPPPSCERCEMMCWKSTGSFSYVPNGWKFP